MCVGHFNKHYVTCPILACYLRIYVHLGVIYIPIFSASQHERCQLAIYIYIYIYDTSACQCFMKSCIYADRLHIRVRASLHMYVCHYMYMCIYVFTYELPFYTHTHTHTHTNILINKHTKKSLTIMLSHKTNIKYSFRHTFSALSYKLTYSISLTDYVTPPGR